MSEFGIIILSPSEDQIKKSQQYLRNNPKGYNSKSYRQGGIALQSGKLAEICFKDYFGGKYVDCYDYDFVLKGYKIDIKTKACSDFEPKDDWYCSVPTYYKQKTDYYVFARVNKNLSRLWFVGWIKKNKLFEIGTFVKKGEVDPDSSPNKIWICPADSYYIKIKELNKFRLKTKRKNDV